MWPIARRIAPGLGTWQARGHLSRGAPPDYHNAAVRVRLRPEHSRCMPAPLPPRCLTTRYALPAGLSNSTALRSTARPACLLPLQVRMPDGQPVNLRVGIHSGPCVSGLVGLDVPRWSVYGECGCVGVCAPGCALMGRVQQMHDVCLDLPS